MTTRAGKFIPVGVLATMAVAVFAAPSAVADPDPRLPDGGAGWCAGGLRPGYGGQNHCLGAPFTDGTFYQQTWAFGPSGIFAPGHWFGQAECSQWIEGAIQGAWPGTGACGGGPMAREIS